VDESLIIDAERGRTASPGGVKVSTRVLGFSLGGYLGGVVWEGWGWGDESWISVQGGAWAKKRGRKRVVGRKEIQNAREMRDVRERERERGREGERTSREYASSSRFLSSGKQMVVAKEQHPATTDGFGEDPVCALRGEREKREREERERREREKREKRER
jgi:hypothetical protein